MTQALWLQSEGLEPPALIVDNQGALIRCDECPCIPPPPPPWCPVCLEFQSMPYYLQTNYLKITGLACNEDCATTLPHVLGTYDTRGELDNNPDWLGCVWAEWVTPGGDCLNWYGINPDCTISFIAQSKSCADPPDPPPPLFVPGKYRLVFNYTIPRVKQEWVGMLPQCVFDTPDSGFIDPSVCFNTMNEFQDYVAYIEESTKSSNHIVTAGMDDQGQCVVFVDGVVDYDPRLDWVLNYYEYEGPCV